MISFSAKAAARAAVVSPDDRELVLENERLRRENRIMREERDILKNRRGLQPACAR